MHVRIRYSIYGLLLVASVSFSVLIPLKLSGGKLPLLARLTGQEVAIILILLLISWSSNASRVRMLLSQLGSPLSFFEALLIVAIVGFATVATPWGIGMPVAYTYLLRKHGTGTGQAAGITTAIVLLDVLFYTTLIPAAALAEFLMKGAGFGSGLSLIALSFIAGAILIVCLLFHFHRRLFLWFGQRLYRIQWFEEFIHAMQLMRKMTVLQKFGLYLVTLCFWLPRYAVLVFLLYDIGQKVPLPYIVLVQIVLNIAGPMLLLPAGSGSVGAGYAILMSPYLSDSQIAFTLIVWRSSSFFWYLIVGIPLLIYETGKTSAARFSRKRLHE